MIEPPGGTPENDIAPEILFVKVPDEKVVKNRLHFDLRPKDQGAEVERIIELGAERVDIGQSDVGWVVLADPEGNEFCVLQPPPLCGAGVFEGGGGGTGIRTGFEGHGELRG